MESDGKRRTPGEYHHAVVRVRRDCSAIICEGCGRVHAFPDGDRDLPARWTRFLLRGWVGWFYACSDKCFSRMHAGMFYPGKHEGGK